MSTLPRGDQRHDNALIERLRGFLVQHCEPPRCGVPASLQEVTSQSSTARTLWTQQVDCMKLLGSCPELGEPLYADTLTLLNTLRTESAALCQEASQAIRPDDISIRLTHLPTLSLSLPTLPPRHGQLVQVCGSIVRMSTKRVVPYAYRLMCPRCHNVAEAFTHPFDRAGQPKQKCEGSHCKKEELQVVGQVWMDYAECRLQQRSNQSGRLPRSVLVTLDDELSTKCGVGQFVEVIGILYPTWRHLYPLSRPAIEPAIWAINVLPMEAYRGAALMAGSGATTAAAANQQRRRNGQQGEQPKFSPEAFFTSFLKNKRKRGVALVNSTAPQLSGLFAPRMSILLSALNGTSMAGKTSMHIRSTIHCLFVGDPSTGKSQLLRFAAAVAPRSTSTTGMGSTSAGLTVAATKEQGEWVLEPGALVLSDGGVCVIDELRTVSPADRASLHEAMEQQTISVAKGGLVTKLRTACSVLSACNPPPLKRNGRPEIGVGGPLLSRFDFIFLLWDNPQSDVDNRVADHVLSCNVANRRPDPPLAAEDLARYLWWLRAQYALMDGPFLSDAAAELLGRYYEIQRQRGSSPSLEDAVPVTIRLLESLVRITQAHAKLHLQSVCTLDDAAMAIFLMERSAHSLKVPLRVLGPDVYSSTRELEDVFLSETPECLALQEAVLNAIVGVVRRYTLPTAPPPAATTSTYSSAGLNHSAEPYVPSSSTSRSREGAPQCANPAAPAADDNETDESQRRDEVMQYALGSQMPTGDAADTNEVRGFRGPSDNTNETLFSEDGGRPKTQQVGGAAMSQYERCRFELAQKARSQCTQSSGDELADDVYDLLAFRRHQLQQTGIGALGALLMNSATPRKSQDELLKESAAALEEQVNQSFSSPRSVATYGADAFGPRDDTTPLRKRPAYDRPTSRTLPQDGSPVLLGPPRGDAVKATAPTATGDHVLTRGGPHMDLSQPPAWAPMSRSDCSMPGPPSCPPSVQQTAPFWTCATSQVNPGLASDAEGTPAVYGAFLTSQLVAEELRGTSNHPSSEDTQAAKKRKRSAEDIMRSLRFHL